MDDPQFHLFWSDFTREAFSGPDVRIYKSKFQKKEPLFQIYQNLENLSVHIDTLLAKIWEYQDLRSLPHVTREPMPLGMRTVLHTRGQILQFEFHYNLVNLLTDSSICS